MIVSLVSYLKKKDRDAAGFLGVDHLKKENGQIVMTQTGLILHKQWSHCVITHNDKRGGPGNRCVSIPPKKERIVPDVEAEDGTREWSERISKITSCTGQSEQEIRRIIGVPIDYDSDEEDEEVIAVQQVHLRGHLEDGESDPNSLY